MMRYIRRKPMSAKQAEVMKIVRAGGCIRLMPYSPPKGRVLNERCQPVMNIQERTFDALKSSQRIKFDQDILSWTHNNKRILNPNYNDHGKKEN